MPQLSIIVPVYNVEKYLSRCIESILEQTYTDFELILINDGSPDDCESIMDCYALKDSRIITIHQENRGVSAARNAGLKIARGKYVGFVDPDDWVEKEMYQLMMEATIDATIDLVCCNWKEDGVSKEISYTIPRFMNNEEFSEYFFKIPKSILDSVCNKIFRKQLIDNIYFDTSISQAEDYLFMCKIIEKVSAAKYIGQSLYNVTCRPGSASRSGVIVRIPALEVRNMVLKQVLENKRIKKFAIVETLDLCFRFKYQMEVEDYGLLDKKVLKHKIKTIIFQNILLIIFNKNIFWKTKILYLITCVLK